MGDQATCSSNVRTGRSEFCIAWLHHLAGAPLGERLADQLVVQGMAGLHRDEVADHRHAQKREVADGVEDLVAHELIGEAKPLGVQDVEVVHHHGVLQGTAPRQARAVQLLHVALEAESARPRDLLPEGAAVQLESASLVADQRVLEVDRVRHAEVPGRQQLCHLVTVRDGHRLAHLQEATRSA